MLCFVMLQIAGPAFFAGQLTIPLAAIMGTK